LLYRPDWLFLDEASSALDVPTERRMYELLRQRLPGATVISIAHKPEVVALHRRQRRHRSREPSPDGRRGNCRLIPASEKHRLAMTPEGQRNHDLALSLSKGGPGDPSVLRPSERVRGQASSARGWRAGQAKTSSAALRRFF
jgi:hypothetical protein